MTGTCLYRCATQICEDLCHSETQICGSLDLWVTQTRAHPYSGDAFSGDAEGFTGVAGKDGPCVEEVN